MTDENELDPYRVFLEGIDAGMKRCQWINWAIETTGIEENPTKVPKRPNDPRQNAKTNDATTWGSFDDALDTADGRDLGIGLSFAQASPFVALDIDVPGGEGWVPSLDRLGGAVIERSPSGNLRAYLRDVTDPAWWKNQGEAGKGTREVKVFNDTGYVTVTGDVLDGHGPPIGETSQVAFEAWLKEAWRAFHDEDDEEPWREPDAASDEPRGSQTTTTANDDRDGLTEDEARDALRYIDPDVPYDTWRNIGFALADEFPRGIARSLYTEWSRRGSKWDENVEGQAARIIENADPAGANDCTIATVVYHAKDGGWVPPWQQTDPFDSLLADLGVSGTDGNLAAESASEVPTADAETDGGVAAARAPSDDETDPGNDPESDADADETDPDEWDIVRLVFGDDSSPNGRAISEATSLLLDALPTLTERETGSTLVYDDETGVFDQHGEMVLQRRLVERLGDAYRSGRQREIVARVTGHTETPIEDIGGPTGRLCVANGVLDLRPLTDGGDPVLREHSPEYRFRSAARAPFDPDAECPRFEAFIGEVVRDDDRETLQEYAGYTLMHWGQPYKRAALLLGPQDSGKSTFLDVIVAVLGETNVSGENLDSLVNSRWGVAETYRKFANITNELDTNALYSLGRFKTLVGGDSLISAERKGENKFDFRPTAKHMFAANEVPPAKDADDAFHERWLHVSFPRSIPKHEQEKNLDGRIIEDELAGVLNWMIEGYARLVQQDGFSRDPYVADKRERWESYGDSIKRFKHNCLDATGDPDEAVVKEIAYALYTAYCEHIGVVAESQSKLTRDLKTDSKITDGKRRVHPDDKRRTVYVGVGFNEDALNALDFDPGAMLDHMRNGDRDDGKDENPDSGLGDFRQ